MVGAGKIMTFQRCLNNNMDWKGLEEYGPAAGKMDQLHWANC